MKDEDFDKLYEEYDTDHNGTISKEEMFEMVLNIFGYKNIEIDYSKIGKKSDGYNIDLEIQQTKIKQ